MLKALIYCICYLIYPFSFLFPRRKHKCAFGSFRGAFNDNSKYLFIHVCENEKDIDAAWISANKNTAKLVRSLGFKAYWVLSPKGAFHALTSKYWFFNAYTSDIIFCLSGGATCINLWHGIGLKRTEFNTVSGPLADRYIKHKFKEVFFHPESFRRPDYLLTSSPFQTVMFAKAFRVPKSRCLELGYPRNSILTKEKSEILDYIAKYEPEETRTLIDFIQAYRKVYIYMPTWRDSQREIFVQNIDLSKMNEVLSENNDILLLKPHANTIIKDDITDYSNIRLLDSKTDVYPILPFTDTLITDYSSILYDYILMPGKDVILYLYDYDDYVKERDFYYPFDENVIGAKAFSSIDLLYLVKKGTEGLDNSKRNEIIDRFWGESANLDSSISLISIIRNN